MAALPTPLAANPLSPNPLSPNSALNSTLDTTLSSSALAPNLGIAPVSPSTPTNATGLSAMNGTAQFYSAPPALQTSRDHPSSYSVSTPSSPVAAQTQSVSRPSQNDILRRIVKADNNGIKKKSHHFKGMKGSIVPPPPLSKYKRPPPIIPNRPGERYPLGIPYSPCRECADCVRRLCAREDCAQNSKASVSRHCISEYVQKGARGSCIPKDLRVEWCNTCYMTHRRDADYYPRVFSLLLDQLEICAREDNATNFFTLYKDEEILVDLIGAHEFILRIWEKWDRDGKIRKFRVIPEKY